MGEWLEDVNDIRIGQRVNEQIMILKAGEASQGKARKFYDGWRPSVRNWDNFEEDFLTAFLNYETYHTKLLRAANMKSSDFSCISEYGLANYPDLPWNRVSSPVIGGITSNAVRGGIRLHQPKDQKELMLLLGQYEAKNDSGEPPAKRHKTENKSQFLGKCFSCGKTGHKRYQCYNTTPNVDKAQSSRQMTDNDSLPKCNYCKRVDHTEATCFKKLGKTQIRCMTINRCEIMPTASTPSGDQNSKFTYMGDSGADWSVIHHHVVKSIGAVITPSQQKLAGFGRKLL
ncbi:hypothetical protein QE152_g3501 [Popillia japonica]|uniref:CCHC-type domain-containing protein n=1 Tax=Popillia japonica TaxID=7064 RepID=A0AAW1N3S7_POPJA